MMSMRLVSCLVVLLVLFSSGEVFATEPVPIRYGYPDQSIWTTKTTNGGSSDNPLLKFVEEVFAVAKVEWSATPYPAHRLFHYLQIGESNFSILVRAKALETCCIFSNTPIATADLRVYRRSTSLEISGKEDLVGKRLIVVQGYSYGKLGAFLKENETIMHEAGSHHTAFAMLAGNRAEYLLDYSGPSEEVLRDQPIDDIVFDALETLEVFLVLSRSYPEAPAVMASFEEIAKTIDVRRWGLTPPHQ